MRGLKWPTVMRHLSPKRSAILPAPRVGNDSSLTQCRAFSCRSVQFYLRRANPRFRYHSQGLGDTGAEVTGRDGSWFISWSNPKGQPDAARRGKNRSPAFTVPFLGARDVVAWISSPACSALPFFLSLCPQVISGDPFEQSQDGFPIDHGGNDGGKWVGSPGPKHGHRILSSPPVVSGVPLILFIVPVF
jgi:hypothetical protein